MAQKKPEIKIKKTPGVTTRGAIIDSAKSGGYKGNMNRDVNKSALALRKF